MKIIIRTVSDIYCEKNPPCPSAVLEKEWFDKTVAEGKLREWSVIVNTIEDILEISKDTGVDVCVKASGVSGFFNRDKDVPILTIYDGYRE